MTEKLEKYFDGLLDELRIAEIDQKKIYAAAIDIEDTAQATAAMLAARAEIQQIKKWLEELHRLRSEIIGFHLDLGGRIRKLRDAHGLTQESFADKIDETPSVFQGIETNKAVPTAFMLQKIAKVFGISVETLTSKSFKLPYESEYEDGFGKRLSIIRHERGLEARNLAYKLQVYHKVIDDIEEGHNFPAPSFLSRIAEALEVDKEKLIYKSHPNVIDRSNDNVDIAIEIFENKKELNNVLENETIRNDDVHTRLLRAPGFRDGIERTDESTLNESQTRWTRHTSEPFTRNFYFDLGERIRKLRDAHGLSQVEFSRAIDEKSRTLQEIEENKTEPTVFMLQKIAKTFEISMEILTSKFLNLPYKSEYDDGFGKRMATIREKRWLNVRNLARKLRVHHKVIEDMEAGYNFPAPSFLSRIAEALKIDKGELLGKSHLVKKEALRDTKAHARLQESPSYKDDMEEVNEIISESSIMPFVGRLPSDLGERIRKLRDAHGLTQESFAENIDEMSYVLHRIEKNKEEPTTFMLQKIAKALDVSVATLTFESFKSPYESEYEDGLGERIMVIRQEQGLNASNLAQKLRVRIKVIEDIEAGNNFPAPNFFSRIAEVLKVDKRKLLCKSPDVVDLFDDNGEDATIASVENEKDTESIFHPMESSLSNDKLGEMNSFRSKPVAISLFGKRFLVDCWENILVRVCETMVLRKPYKTVNFVRDDGLNPAGRICFSFEESQIEGKAVKLSNGLYVSIEGKPEDIHEQCRHILALCGYNHKDFYVELPEES